MTERADDSFRVIRRGFQFTSAAETDVVVGASEVEGLLRRLLDDVGGVEEEFDEFIILAQEDNAAGG